MRRRRRVVGYGPAVGMTARRHGVHVASTGAPEVSEWIKGPSPRMKLVTGAIRDG